MSLSKELHTASALIAALEANGCEPLMIEVATRKRTFGCILCGAKKDGTFCVAIPTGFGGTDEPFEMTYHIDDVKVFADR